MNLKLCIRRFAVLLLCLFILIPELQAHTASQPELGNVSSHSDSMKTGVALSGSTSLNFNEACKQVLLKFCSENGESSLALEDSLRHFEERLDHKREELRRCYEILSSAIDRGILTSKSNHVELCKHLIIELGDPSQVNQGNHNTCTLAALETKLYTEAPSVVCSIILQALSGTITGFSGQTAKLPADLIEPDRESRLFHVGSPCRSYASQIFQIAVANLYWQNQTEDPRGIKVPLGSLRYIQQPGGPTFHGDTGERLVIRWADDIREHVASQSGMPENSPAFSMRCLMGAYEMLTGRSAKPFLLAHKSRPENKPATLFNGSNDLANKLSNLKQSGQLPAIIAIHPNGGVIQTAPRLTFRAAPGVLQLITPKCTSWHVVCVTDYKADTGEVNIDNFWGPRSDFVKDRSLQLSELHASTYESKPKK